jgi:hypothetical protein
LPVRCNLNSPHFRTASPNILLQASLTKVLVT